MKKKYPESKRKREPPMLQLIKKQQSLESIQKNKILCEESE